MGGRREDVVGEEGREVCPCDVYGRDVSELLEVSGAGGQEGGGGRRGREGGREGELRE